ncbi:hypothetical protein KOW79_016870 [Hemibagrus wyckioides]|uniref:Uncharacterized protein n=1 Tax=Hemibagrus wyckioides TaxID=337641 RepID=A0A9D3NF56_9TELE|nr:hypothetical protein KOW79_016870 [Hemibagrus wyckioides]
MISCLSSREGGSLEFNMEATLSLWQHRELGWKQGPNQGQMEQNSEVDPLKGNLEQEYADRSSSRRFTKTNKKKKVTHA